MFALASFVAVRGGAQTRESPGAAGGSVPRRPARRKGWSLQGLDADKDTINWVCMVSEALDVIIINFAGWLNKPNT